MNTSGILVSSPVRPNHSESVLLLASSPDLPPLTELSRKALRGPPLRNGKNAALISATAAQTLASVGSLWRSGQLQEAAEEFNSKDGSNRLEKSCRSKSRPKAAAKSLPDTSIEIVEQGGSFEPEVTQKTQQRQQVPLNTVTNDTWETSPSKLEQRKKLRSEPKPGVEQQAGANGRSTGRKVKVKGPRKKPETMSRHFPASESVAPAPTKRIQTPKPIDLEPAMKRRIDWTPPPANTIVAISSSSPIKELSSPATRKCPGADEVFKNLRDSFECKLGGTAIAPRSENGNGQEILKKRKLIEIVMATKENGLSGEAQPSKSPLKPKAQKKKPRTITELATAAYAAASESSVKTANEAEKAESLLGYFLRKGDDQTEVPGAKAKRKASRKPATKKGESRRQVLLSPTSAMRQSFGQDFVFGTSSQLATEQSPTFLKDLQRAIQASNKVEDPFASSSPAAISVPTAQASRSRLWAAGARGADGELLELEVVDLVDSPEPPKDYLADPIRLIEEAQRHQLVLETGSGNGCMTGVTKAPESGFDSRCAVAVEHPSPSQDSPIPISSSPLTGIVAKSNTNPCLYLQPSVPFGRAGGEVVGSEEAEEPPPSNQEQQALSHNIAVDAAAGLIRPKYELFTDAQLAKEIRTYGFKPVKKRVAMVALLEQCWTSKNSRNGAERTVPSASISTATAISRTSTTSSPTRVAASVTTRPRGRPRKDDDTGKGSTDSVETNTSPSKKPRGRPRKQVAATNAPIAKPTLTATTESAPNPAQPKVQLTPKRQKPATRLVIEIPASDSEELLTSPEQVFSSSQAIDLSMNDDTEMSLTISPTREQSSLFTYITKVVTSEPRSKDPLDPSWHEKMLMYDPIVLEDLTAWLNSGQLDRVGFDGEVSPFDVKKWCESKSICCLWRMKLNGQERKRF